MRKLSKYFPSILIMVTVLLIEFQGPLFYVSAAISIIVILFLLFRAQRSEPPVPTRSFWFLPLVFSVGIFGTAAASPLLGLFFGMLGSYLFYYYYLFFPKNIPVFIEQTTALFTAFVFSSFSWSLSYYFMLPPWATIFFSALGFYLLFRHRLAALGALVGTLVMAETTWVLQFWPIHFFSLAVVSLAVFYLIFMFSHLHSIGKLSTRKIYFQVSLIAVVVILTLLSSPWQPINRI